MGRKIDLTRPLSAEDRAYLMERSREGDVAVNERQFGSLSEAEQDEERSEHDANEEADQKAQEDFEAAIKQQEEESYPEHLVAKVEPLTLNQLKAALKKRKLDATGDLDALRVRLIEFLEEQDEKKATASVGESKGE